MYIALFLSLGFCCLQVTSGNQTYVYSNEIRSLSELPMDKLIKIKTTLADERDLEEEMEEDVKMSSRKLSLKLPVALPLRRSNKKPTRRYEDHYEEKGKDTKISKIFQLAVTSLSFLAFGGYLLTLIITAIRRNSTNQGQGNVIVLSNLQTLQKYKRPKRNIVLLDPMENDYRIERLYEGMIMLSRTYALYN